MRTISVCLLLLGLAAMSAASYDCDLSTLRINMGQADDCVINDLSLHDGDHRTYCDTTLTCVGDQINAEHNYMIYEGVTSECVKLVKATSASGTHIECDTSG